MTAQYLELIDAIMTLPGSLLEKEVQRRITAINAVTMYCGIEEGTCYHSRRHGYPIEGMTIKPKVEKPIKSDSETALSHAILSVQTDQRPQICFLCVGNKALPISEQVKEYATIGLLSRHFRRHVKRLEIGKQIDCQICNIKGMHQMLLQNHIETCHGTVTQVKAE